MLKNLKHWLFQTVQTEQRTIFSGGAVSPVNYMSNKIDNTRYNWFTFVPMVFYNQFKHFLNLYFLAIALMQFYQPLRVGGLSRLPHHLHLADHHHPHGLLH